MSRDPNNVVRVAAGEMVVVELYKQELVEAGIDAHVLGESLEASFGTAIPRSVELWVHESDALRAQAIIQRMEEERGETVVEREKFPHPVSDPTRPHGGHGPHTHYDTNPGG